MTTLTSASNTLYRGEARDFLHAMELVQQECAAEKRIQQDLEAALRADGEAVEPSDPIFDEYAANARRAAGIYRTHLDAARVAAAAEMRALGEDMALFAEALESGEYSGLAI